MRALFVRHLLTNRLLISDRCFHNIQICETHKDSFDEKQRAIYPGGVRPDSFET
jgi:hypothetical protein